MIVLGLHCYRVFILIVFVNNYIIIHIVVYASLNLEYVKTIKIIGSFIGFPSQMWQTKIQQSLVEMECQLLSLPKLCLCVW